MLEQIVFVLISALTATIGTVFGGFIISKKLKNDLKAEFFEFLESEQAPKLFYGIGQTFGAGLFSKAGGLNPMKGNINLMGVKIPKVLAFGIAQKMGWLPNNILGEGEVAPTSPNNPIENILEKFK